MPQDQPKTSGNADPATYRRAWAAAGFTVLEIVAVLGIFLMALGIGFATLGDWRAQSRFNGVLRGFQNAVTLTRARAIARQKPVILQVRKPVPRDQWKASENYVIREVYCKTPACPERADYTDGREYWLEFQFVDEKKRDGTDDYQLIIGGTIINASLNYNAASATERGAICFNARGYAMVPQQNAAPSEFLNSMLSEYLRRQVMVRVSPIGDIEVRNVP